jgi:hypothetical protein
MEGIPEVEQMSMWCTDFLIVIFCILSPKITKVLFPKDLLYKWKTVCEGLSNLHDFFFYYNQQMHTYYKSIYHNSLFV